MTPAEKAYLLRWSIPVATGFGLFVWGLVLLRIERRQKKSKGSNSGDH